MNSEFVVLHDECPRRATWMPQYVLPRVPLAQAMHEALRVGLIAGDPIKAKEAFVEIASSPGLDIQAYNVYEIAMHHAAMMEVICAYLVADGAWEPAEGLQSYILPDGRLRRVVLCSAWNPLREDEERTSWRTVADTVYSGRPMLINAIVIGQSRKGFRSSPWTTGFIHPENHMMRIQKREGKFNDNWKKVYRENTDKKPEDWLYLMQEDGAFDNLVYSVDVDVPENRKEITADLERIEIELQSKSTVMRRSACYKMSPCPFARVCHHTNVKDPKEAGWKSKMC